MKASARTSVTRFLDAWLAARQVIQAANFNRFQSAGLSATQFMTLSVLPAGEGVMTLTELARRLNLRPATVTKTIDSLEARGLVVRTKSAVDRRSVALGVTTAGASLQNAASSEFHEHMARLFARMDAAERDGLVVGLEGLVRVAAATTLSGDAPPASRSSPRSPKPRS